MKAIINNSTCMIVSRERLTRGTVGKTMEAEFSADWEGLAITATFEAGDEKRDKVYTGEPIVIPHEVLTTAGVSVMLGFQGALPDGTIVKRTEKEWLNNVSETLDPAGVQSSEPTPDWTAQVQNIATEAKQVADSVRSDADAGKFNGPAGDPGGWYTPAITQPDENTIRMSFTPSKEGMPAVPPKDITIPAGGGTGGSGEDGGYYSPSVDADGNLKWTASKTDMPAIDGTNIKGPKGVSGVYVGSGDMPDGYNVQIDPDGTPSGIIPPIPIVDSVDEMVDTSKQYILKSTGTIWAYKSSTTEQEVTVRNDITSGYERGRLSSGGANAGDVSTHTLTPLIDLTKAEYQGKTIQIHLEGNRYVSESNETYIQFAIYKTDKSVLNGRSATCLDKAYSILPVLANVTTEINNTTSATITITMPAQYNGTEIGYMRFCGLGTVDGTVYITYKETQTVTSEQWVDTGIQYDGGGLDEETAAKISELNNEGTDPTTIKLLAQPVLNFYNASAYSDNDYTYSHLSKITYPCRADIPIPFTVKWNHNEDAMRTTVAVDTKAIGTLNAYTMRTYDATGFDNYPLYNLLPNTTYYYKVTHVLSDGSLIEAKSGSFTTSAESWRLLYIEGTQNVRDLGGWTGLNGKKVKYGKIIRGAALSDSSSNSLIVTGKGKLALGELKIQAELNLGAIDNATSVAANCAYKKIGYTNYAIAITDETRRAQFKEVLEWIVSCLDGTLNVNGLYQVQRNIYMHCQGGCDRTGTLSFQLLGLLGVSESDLAKEYELSSFSDVGFGRLRTTTKAVDTYDYVGMVEALKTYSGDTITDKFYNFATTGCGISADTITSFRNLMLE